MALTFEDPSNIGKDYSGNGNDFTATGFDLTPPGVWTPGVEALVGSLDATGAPITRLFDGNTSTSDGYFQGC